MGTWSTPKYDVGPSDGPDSDGERDPCCTGLEPFDIGDEAIARDVRTLSALSNHTRYVILLSLANTSAEVCACDLDPLLDVSQSTISRALHEMYDADLVSRRRDGRWRYYAVTEPGTQLLHMLADVRRKQARDT